MWSEVNKKREFCILGTRFFLSNSCPLSSFLIAMTQKSLEPGTTRGKNKTKYQFGNPLYCVYQHKYLRTTRERPLPPRKVSPRVKLSLLNPWHASNWPYMGAFKLLLLSIPWTKNPPINEWYKGPQAMQSSGQFETVHVGLQCNIF